ncbi:MAG: fatty acid hydroxylase, partial [Betaproteobacteria bacterium]|nr:fatty acid hydroxylase [Betaproteobacteria bacterium]NDE93322.1 fatty acid hydroxylase [Betaproteobacteria bacterium]
MDIQDLIALPQQWLFEHWVQPLMFAIGWGQGLDAAFDATEWLVWGVYELLLMVVVLGWMERRWPVEALRDRAAVRLDMFFTGLHRLGLFPLIAFAVLV